MDGISAAASVLAIGTAGVQISIKLIAFSNQVATASERVRSIGVDISLTANVLQQLGELMRKPQRDESISIFSEEGLATTQASAAACEEVFQDLEIVLKKANGQFRIKEAGAALGKKITLSKIEALKWPFLQPGVDSLRTTLNNARETLMLILHVTTLAYMKKLAELNYPSAPSLSEQSQQVSAILALRRSQAAPVPSTTMILHRESPSAPQDNQRAPKSPTLDSSDFRSQDGATEPLPPGPPLAHNLFHGTADRFASQNDVPTNPTTGFRSGPLREVDVGVPGRFSTTGFGDERTQPAQYDQNDRNFSNSSGSALSNDTNSNKHRQTVDISSELSKSMEVWSIEPMIRRAEDHNGYDIEWVMHCLQLSPSEFKDESRRFRRPFWQKKQSVREQFANLSQQERYVLERFQTEAYSDFPGHFSMKNMKFVKMRPAKEPITRMPWRGIHVLVERTDAAVKDRRSAYYSKPLFPSRPHRMFGGGQPQSGLFGVRQPQSRLFGVRQPRSGLFGGGQPQSSRFGGGQPQSVHVPPDSNASMHNHIPYPGEHHRIPSMNFQGPQYHPIIHPHNDRADEIRPGKGSVPRNIRHYERQRPSRIIETEPRTGMPSHLRLRREARDRTQSLHDLSSDSRSSGSDFGDRNIIHCMRHAPACSDGDMSERRKKMAELYTVKSRTENADAPAPHSEEAEAEEMQNSDMVDEAGEAPTSEELAAEPSVRIIDELLAKYTTIYG